MWAFDIFEHRRIITLKGCMCRWVQRRLWRSDAALILQSVARFVLSQATSETFIPTTCTTNLRNSKAGAKFKVQPIVCPNCQTICCRAERSCSALNLTGSSDAQFLFLFSHDNVSRSLQLTLKSVTLTWSKHSTSNLDRSCSVVSRKSRWNGSPAVDLRVSGKAGAAVSV